MEEVCVVREGDQGTGGQEVLLGPMSSPSQQGKDGEHQVCHELIDQGYAVYRTGWPDFICGRELNGVKHIMAVEVKTGNAVLTLEQKAVARLLVNAGVQYWVHRPDTDQAEQLKFEGPLVEKVCRCCGCPQ